MSIDNRSILKFGTEVPVVVGTRFWASGTNPEKDLARLALFLESSQSAADETLVAVNVEQDAGDTEAFVAKLGHKSVSCLPVRPWGFAPALNALIRRGMSAGHDQILFASVEIPPKREHVRYLQGFMTSNSVTIGAALEHDYQPGTTIPNARASQIPWNTFCLTDLQKSALGVPLIADEPQNPECAGMEEATTLAVNQRLFGHRAALVEIPGLRDWTNTAGWSEEREQAHRR